MRVRFLFRQARTLQFDLLQYFQGAVMNKHHKINHTEIAAAIQMFQKKGGLIVRLPDQNAQPHMVIGNEKYDPFEPISRLINLS